MIMYLLIVISAIILGIFSKNLYIYFIISPLILFIKENKIKYLYILFILVLVSTALRKPADVNFYGNILGKVISTKEDRFVVKTHKINNKKIKKNIVFYGKEKNGRLVSIDGVFKRPLGQMNRGNFNKRLNYLSENINYIGQMYHENVLKEGDLISTFVYNFREKLKDNIYENLPKKEAGILSSILLSDRAYLDEDDLDNFSYLGINHILALSGFHIAILAIFLEKIFLKLSSSKKLSDFLSLFLIGFYIFLVGFPVGALRAYSFLFFYKLRFYLRLNIDRKEILHITGLIMLLINPFSLFSLSFLMSYGAVIGIFYIYPRLIIKCPKKNFVIESFVLTFSVLLVIFPIINTYFSGVNIIVFLANLIIIPLYSLVIILGYFLSIGFSFLSVFIDILFKSIWGLENLLMVIANLKIEIFALDFNHIFLYYILLYFLFIHSKYIKIFYGARKFFYIYMAWLMIFSCVSFYKSYNSLKEIHFYIGQGDASLISYRGKNFLIDVGGARRENKIFENFLYPALKNLGIKKVDAIFISHFDEDHAGNLDKVLENFKVGKIYSSYDDNIHRLIILKKGDFYRYKDLTFKVISDSEKFQSPNDKSMVLLVEFMGKRILYTGDISQEVEKTLKVKADILKVAHHGSRGSSSSEFLKNLKAKVAIISCGIDNEYKHPHKEAIDRLRENKIKLFTTQNHEVDVIINKNFLWVGNYCKVNIDGELLYNFIFALLLGVLLKKYELQGNL